MSARLDRRDDFEGLAAASDYRVDVLARKMGRSPRSLQRLFHKKFSASPKQKIDEWRAKKLTAQIRRGDLVKAAARDHGFKYASHASKFVKRVLKVLPRSYRQE